MSKTKGILNPSNKRASMFGATYDLLEFHVTVIMILHENQRSTSLLGLSRPHFSENNLTKADTRGSWSLHPSGTPSSKEMVSLPATSTNNHRISNLSNWFWLTDWQIDYSDPRVDPTSGWQYAKSFADDDATWTPVAPTSGYNWVRRRRWVRVMKRRMDLTKGSHRGENVTIANVEEEEEDNAIEEQDYLLQAETIIQSVQSDITTESDGRTRETLTKDILKYNRAIDILTDSIKSKYLHMSSILFHILTVRFIADENEFRKHQASTLVRSYMSQIDRLNNAVEEMVIPSSVDAVEQQERPLVQELEYIQPNTDLHDNNDSNPWANTTPIATTTASRSSDPASANKAHLPSQRLNTTGDNFENDTSGQNQEQPERVWESDTLAKTCRICVRKFGLLLRRHHCRRCGLVVCDKCSPWKVFLNASDILQDPEGTLESVSVLAYQQQRICDKCYDERKHS